MGRYFKNPAINVLNDVYTRYWVQNSLKLIIVLFYTLKTELEIYDLLLSYYEILNATTSI